MAKFKPKKDFQGFDLTHRWQMIPLDGSRDVVLENGANMNVTLKEREILKPLPLSVASFQEISASGQNNREFRIKGHQAKKAIIHAESSNDSTKLYLTILPAKKLKLDLFFLEDAKLRKTKQNGAEIRRLVSEATTDYFYTQTNVSLSINSFNKLIITKDLGNEIDLDELLKCLNDGTWAETHPSVIFVWEFEFNRKGYTGDEAGFAFPPYIILEDGKTAASKAFRSKLLAHEVAHYFIGPDHHDNENNLLFKKPFERGAYLRKEQILKFNKMKPAYWSF